MKIALVYYSTTGNTKLACEYIKRSMQGIHMELLDFLKITPAQVAEYDVIGFAFFTDAWNPPQIFQEFIQMLPEMSGKYAFAFNTFGCISGKSSQIMFRLLQNRGFRVIAAFSLHTPENYPPMIASGREYSESPKPKEFKQFQKSICRLQESLEKIVRGEDVLPCKPELRPIDRLVPANPARFTSVLFGETKMEIDHELCIQCGLCARYCPAKAISVLEKVQIDQEKCQKCWSCYNHCPRNAVKAGKYTGQGKYTKPPVSYQNKF